MTHAHCRGIWVFAEQTDGTLCPTTLELLAKAQELKAVSGSSDPVTAVLLGNAVEPLAQTLIAHGADTVLLAEHPNLAQYKPRTYKNVLAELARKYEPSIFVTPT